MKLYKNDLPDNLFLGNSVAIDTETMGLNTKRDRLCLVQLCGENGEIHLVQIDREDAHNSPNLKKLLKDKNVLKIFHYARFDVAILEHTFSVSVFPIYCTKIASKLVRTYTDKHSLKVLARELLNVELSKQEQSSYWGRDVLSPTQLEYAANDVRYLHQIKEQLDIMLQREGKTELANKCFEQISLIVQLELANFSPEELFQH